MTLQNSDAKDEVPVKAGFPEGLESLFFSGGRGPKPISPASGEINAEEDQVGTSGSGAVDLCTMNRKMKKKKVKWRSTDGTRQQMLLRW